LKGSREKIWIRIRYRTSRIWYNGCPLGDEIYKQNDVEFYGAAMSIISIAGLWKEWQLRKFAEPKKLRTPCSVVDPHRFDADPDSTYYPDLDQDSDFIWFGSGFLLDVDPDPTFYPDADPYPDPSFQI
jgi:hypothetical protein